MRAALAVLGWWWALLVFCWYMGTHNLDNNVVQLLGVGLGLPAFAAGIFAIIRYG